MQKHRYIGEFEQIDDGRAGKFRIQLFSQDKEAALLRHAFRLKKNGYFGWERQFPPAAQWAYFVSTSKGIMSHHEAQAQNLGGVLVGYIY